MSHLPRIVIAGLAGDTGKSLVSLGVARSLSRRGYRVAPFKKGPDFIDAAWLGRAAASSCRNLDTFMMPEATVRAMLGRSVGHADLAIIEGNRGLFDGMDAEGSHSTASLARLLGCPVAVVIDATKCTRTVAALVLGCQAMDPDLHLAGIILNRVATARQERVIRDAVRNVSDIPVLGALPKLKTERLPSRHLGLVTVGEHPEAEKALATVSKHVADHLDLTTLGTIAAGAAAIPAVPAPEKLAPCARIGVLRDRAFSFYYPDNLEALENAGAELVPVSTFDTAELPAIDALYAGGGFPEEHASNLANNSTLRHSIARAIDDGLPVWAECGGLMYLSRAVIRNGERFPMVGALPCETVQTQKPQGHGYVSARVDRENPFLSPGTSVRGHEFHYSRLECDETPPTVMALARGTGTGAGRDGLASHNVVASYTHVHAAGLPDWAPALVQAATTGEVLA